MKKIINFLNDEISKKKQSIKAFERFCVLPYVTITDSGYERIHEQRKLLWWYQDKLQTVVAYKPCTCNKFMRYFRRNKFEMIGKIDIYKCKKCDGYFSE